MIFRRLFILLFAVSLLSLPSLAQDAAPAKPKPRVMVIGVKPPSRPGRASKFGVHHQKWRSWRIAHGFRL